MKRLIYLFATLAFIVVTMSSCLVEDNETYAEYNITRVASVTTNSDGKVLFVCDYTGEVFQPDNVTDIASLASFGVDASDHRVLAQIKIYQTYTKTEVTLTGLSPIKVRTVDKKDMDTTVKYSAFTSFGRLQVDNGWAYPYGWVADGYLSVMPITNSVKEPELILHPAGVNGDTLSFDLLGRFEYNASSQSSTYCNYDLRTLTDTIGADSLSLRAMKAMCGAIHAHDSMIVVVNATCLYADTVRSVIVPTGYFRCDWLK